MIGNTSGRDNYSSSDIITHAIRFQINTIFAAIINLMAFYDIIYHSIRKLKNYKWFLLNMEISAAVFNFHLTVVFAFFPISGICTSEISIRNWIENFGEAINFTVVHFLLSYLGLSIFWFTLY